ncbi:D-Ala-D-Ala carboxypeptidase family metallohydrolase [uncultured Cohaesibacter sp.]|uniref:D-Ala-D-Ala carboxypeptidase family metallohydrolase n=1 Tax=uncultured Cohaesibacter sp. TaxID=1002546 RepID=UPI0029C69812|nr:D-Ala-D-Ala carboxypeptidase family metallohydrolase [uncultured Cohaesibacter sp.]
MMSFEQFFAGFGFEHFSAAEILFKGNAHVDPRHKGFGLNTDPPPELWWNIIKTVEQLEWLRKDIGEPIRILSCYRSPAYNAAIGGAPASEHMDFTALDFVAASRHPQYCYDRLKWRRSNGAFSGGLGLYDTFVHIDTRGKDVDW